MLHDPGIMSATCHCDLVGLDTRLPHAYLGGAHLPVSPAFHLLDLTTYTEKRDPGTQDSPPCTAFVIQPQQTQNQLGG